MLRILVLDGSAGFRRLLHLVLESDRDIQILSSPSEPAEVLRMLCSAAPDLIVLDGVLLPGGGLSLITRIMAEAPLPILVLSDQIPQAEDSLQQQALHRGALAVHAKPAPSDRAGTDSIRGVIRRLAKVPVVRHLGRRSKPAKAVSSVGKSTPELPLAIDPQAIQPEVLGIGSSAGGPAVLAEILGELPADFAGCILVVQHLPIGFAQPFAEYLQARMALPVVVATPLVSLSPGLVIMAPDDAHLVLEDRGHVALSKAPPVNGHRPCVDLLFESLARFYGAASAGIVLSGIGSDGTAGLHAIRRVGGLTITQTGESAAVNGMPRSASDSGASQHSLPPAAIAALLRSRFGRGRSSHGG